MVWIKEIRLLDSNGRIKRSYFRKGASSQGGDI